MRITASAPTRIDLAGGTVDIWPLYLFHEHAQTINAAISLRAHAEIIPRTDGRLSLESIDTAKTVDAAAWQELTATDGLPLLSKLAYFFKAQNLTLRTRGESPTGAGIAGSSALNVAVCGALAEWAGLIPHFTLAIVLMEVCSRIGVPARGVSFPGHFLVRCDVEGGHFIIDPFAGRILSRDELRDLYARATGDTREPSSRLLEPASKQQILLRMLANLRAIYGSRRDREHLRAVLERMQVLAPSDELRRELAALGGTTPWRAGGRSVN